MRNHRIQLVGLGFAFLLGAACGDDLIPTGEPGMVCQDKCTPLEVGIECEVQPGVIKVVCGPNEQLAAVGCYDSSGVPGKLVPHCDEGGNDEAGTTTTTTTWGAATWDPKSRIHVDPASGEYVIDVDFFTAVMGDFTAFEADETVLRQNESGAYFIAYVGELAEALGLELGDALISVDGLEIHSFSDFVDAYDTLSSSNSFELTVLRGEERVVLSYRLQ